MIFDIDEESKKLKEYVSKYDSETFAPDVATLFAYIDTPRIEMYPFQGLDSPLRQLSYILALNLTSNQSKVTEIEVASNDEWKEIVVSAIKCKAGYYDLLLNDLQKVENFNTYYETVLPVFFDYFDTSKLNYEEQELKRIDLLFTPFNQALENKIGLNVQEILEIYNIIDNQLFININKPFEFLKDPECKEFSDYQKQNNIRPHDWDYLGTNENIKLFVKHFKNRGERLKISLEDLYPNFDNEKINIFFKLFTIDRNETSFLYYTNDNPVLSNPIVKLIDSKYLILDPKILLFAIYDRLYKIIDGQEKKIFDKFQTHKGKYLENRVCSIFQNYFKKEAHIYKEYTTSIGGSGQDVLVLGKSIAIIIEVKNKKSAIPHSYPKDIKKLFETISKYFKNSIQEGYDQCFRVKELFDQDRIFDIYDEKGEKLYTVNPKKYPNVFNIIVTEERFKKPQIDLSKLLDLNPNDDCYPLSISVDDLEVILLTLKKKKLGLSHLIEFLYLREQLHGRIDSNDELEIWGALINSKKFKIPDNPKLTFRTYPEMSFFYDELYKSGLGFENEKNFDKKKSGNWDFYEPYKALQ